ncbi:hypothetical protein ASF12_22240 [Paenibacillus sp. Leaf72]|nr:hypothetical protein ASF12_22240 [Paenibacillus sp. Leaf72]
MSEKYVISYSALLNESVQYIVVEGQEHALAAINHLKELNLTSAGFIPLNRLKKYVPNDSYHSLVTYEGFLGHAVDLVSYENKYKPLFNFLFNDVIIVDTLENALKISNCSESQHKLITLQGEIVDMGGAILGGGYASSTDILGAKNKISKLTEELENVELAINAIKSDNNIK